MALKYKVGDRVRIKSIDWYNKNKNQLGEICCGITVFVSSMKKYCGKIMTISQVKTQYYKMQEDTNWRWTDKMIEGLVEEESKSTLSRNAKLVSERFAEDVSVSEFKPHQDEIMKLLLQGALNIPEGYYLKNQDGNIINAKYVTLEKKEKEYPKTYEECCRIVNANPYIKLIYDLSDGQKYSYDADNLRLYESIRKLLICRDAYWKLYGEEMGLGKPWEPTNGNGEKVYSIVRCCGRIKKNSICDFSNCYILEFPTKEMRDAFYEHFKLLINECKKLL